MIALISDIHGNIDALTAVLEDIQRQEINDTWCLGDIVGYGAEPAQCVEVVRSCCTHVVVGNHDRLTIDDSDLPYLAEHVRPGILFARENLSSGQSEWLGSLPFSIKTGSVTAVHASLSHPEEFSYLANDQEAGLHFQLQETPFSFVGHTHVPIITVENVTGVSWIEFGAEVIKLDDALKCSINVGSVGQPRDGDPRACYVTFDPFNYSLQIKRVEYDIKAAQRRITDAGLPQVNAARLSAGR